MSLHEDLVTNWETYLKEYEKFEKNGFNSSRVRMRKALLEISKICKERRKELSSDAAEEE